MQDVKKLVEQITSNEIQRCVNAIAYTVTNKTIDYLKDKHDKFVTVLDSTVTQDDDGLIIVKITMRVAK